MKLQKLLAGLLTASLVASVAVGTAAAAHHLIPAAPVAATCEDDECEAGNRCKVNATTSCDVLSTGGCKTWGCSGVRN